ncbi:type I-E CRISPR-associated endonuclease Cas1e [Paraliomyxa miuraensis]|uniref:type I-E CRISPR-associated endonuclease Cas1e n=1 Tax=Paraliomyxa miuraensis TaxID=376150 RepID=UPI00224DE8AF|nr:type I-E CRISPR-associated endonuclease Cas1e [Paraliomyxa miuraensis]MCX4244414.1 type I-E CRISPR-associated endonuclease Cas1e [Paraliomyxa miuraensis]
MLKGRLGLETARIPQVDRHGLVWLERGHLVADDGTVCFKTAGFDDLPAGTYGIPHQTVSFILLGPGSMLSHDAARILARHQTGLAMIGHGGVRLYASLPPQPDQSARARAQARAWADPQRRIAVARRMYAWRLGEVLPEDDITVLRGIEGARVKALYKLLASQHGIPWHGRRYDRAAPEAADEANQAINHASTAVLAMAELAVAISGAIPQLGFIHEDSGFAFALDVADLFRDGATVPVAFAAVKERLRSGVRDEPLERTVRRACGKRFRQDKLVVQMLDKIKELFDADDGGGDHGAS